MIDSGLLAAMRAAQEDLLPDTCTILKVTVSQDGIGQPSRSWSTRASGVACRLVQQGANEKTVGGKAKAAGDWVLTLPHDQTIAATDRVTVGSQTFEVKGRNDGESWETATRVSLAEVVDG